MSASGSIDIEGVDMSGLKLKTLIDFFLFICIEKIAMTYFRIQRPSHHRQ